MLEQKLKEEWDRYLRKGGFDFQQDSFYANKIADFWLHKFKEYYKQILEKDIKTMEGMKKDTYKENADLIYDTEQVGYNSALSDLIDSKLEALNKLNK